PVAQLECRPGFVPVGLGGRVGALIDRLAVQCRALSCFGNPGGQCAGNPSYEYWTDGFGGEGGGPWTGSCPDGNVLVGVGATEDAPSSWMYSLAPRCAPFGAVMSGGATPTQLASVGSYWAGAPATRDCAGGKVLTGFQARSHVDRGELVTGVQPICSADLKGFRSYLGGQGGEASVLRCPNGFRAIGTVQNSQGGAINAFGLLCGPSDLDGAATPDSQVVVAHGGYWHYPGSLPVPAMVEPLAGAHLPPFAAVRRCDGYLLGVTTRADTVVRYINNLMCSEGSTLGNYTYKPVGVGNPIAGVYRAQSCPFFRPIDALYVRHGWSTDGFSLHCRE
ncbi:MAG TPA: hypothetical protein VFS00_20105, partial [Polyangiaceae bacterium]|nr:hypothetical protein [Polyangiaceae bacterium]